MSAWRRLAGERFPQLKNEVDRAASPAALWVELKREFDRAYSHDEDAVIRSVHDYAMWMVEETHSDDLAKAAVEGLYRPLIEENWMAEEWEKRRAALEMAQYLGEERLTLLYWEHLHSLMPAGKHREFIAELGVGKPARRESQK